ncbi:MAG: SAM-dependent methyltransferase [Candidatus Wallbacteria bacterium GWC2_49_35]|uniref:SAM-dependent methyltransferase n=1 Tax=Candidatus Wallbacteria bacterium GWC2_49_35 TaxID=1817813 RepID=A0A1F7WTE5_9BACT|nr:MAG: SAM-dependent methyltransferase [Candidatus Wallbacteria bacterium GWC2_49_35]
MKCRNCEAELGGYFLSLANSPLSNSYLKESQLNDMEPFYPLSVYVCDNCFLVQLDEFEKASNIFGGDYAYFSSYSESWLAHCRAYVEMMIKRFELNGDSFVAEVASNDGYLLQYFKNAGIKVLGIEPASNTAKAAMAKGVDTEVAFFDVDFALKMASSGRAADLIIANNVLAHNPDLINFAGGFEKALKPDGVVTIEFPHLLNLIRENQFDTIYHEHFSYFSCYSASDLLRRHGLTVFDVEKIPTHGGSLRIYARKTSSGAHRISGNVAALIDEEKKFGLLDKKTYFDFSESVKRVKRQFLEFLIGARNEGKKIAAYGAPAKGNTLLNYCGVRTDFIDYTVDLSPHKQGKYLPGTHIPIFSPDRIFEDKPDFLVILPWNIKNEIMEQMSGIRDWGGKFVIPIPRLEVV